MCKSADPELLIGRNKDDLIHDLRNTATDDFDNSEQQSEEGESEEDLYDTDSSLTDYHTDEYEELSAVAYEHHETDSESDSYPNKKPRSQENTHPEGDRRCNAEARSDLLSESESISGEYSIIPNGEYSIIPEKEDWIGSWSANNGKEQKGYYYLNVYGFYKKATGKGGYGVMVRDPCGKPVIASSYVQPQGGVDAAFALALEHGIYDLQLNCNSTLDINLRQIFQEADHGLRGTVHTPYRCGACKTCLRYAIPLTDDEFEIMFPLLVKIIDKRSMIMRKSFKFFVRCVPSSLNQAAYHLAKQLAKKTPMSAKPMTVAIKPDDFEDELKLILYEDAYKGVRLYQQQQKWVKTNNSCNENVQVE
ncbi:hypothetical protein MKW94_017754, partial [Papaver nudicaule]|nr:hypothetical protein [Papaver nudicaule]